MKKQNLILYGAKHPAGYNFWQIFQSEHKIWVADKREQIPGASFWQKPLMMQPIDISKAEYKPVNGVVIFDVHPNDILELFKSIAQKESIKVLIFDTLNDDVISLITDSLCDVEITCLKVCKPIQSLEDLYHVDRIVLKGGNTSYWKEILEEGLLSANVDVEC